jgi:tRNA modification GTPase
VQSPQSSITDTIVACATAPGESAIAVVRLSGGRARAIVQSMAAGRRRSHVMHRARVVAPDGTLLDDALVCEMHAPRSYTGEDVVEVHLHGARYVVDRVVGLAVEQGARLAEPGEFTLRAFVNGRMDLTQAEAVVDVLGAANERQLTHANAQLAGALSTRVSTVLSGLEGVIAAGRASFDFPEYDTGAVLPELAAVEGMVAELSRLVEHARPESRRTRSVVLCGAPNVGKSSLLNAWSGVERVLVDDAPGTTRDPIEVEMTDGLQRWSVWDTAGFRSEAVGLEARGITLALERARRADLAVWIIDGDAPVWPPADLACVVVGGKADCVSEARRGPLERTAAERSLTFLGWVSARTGEGVEALRSRLSRGVDLDERPGELVIVRDRQVGELRSAMIALQRALDDGAAGVSVDMVVGSLEEAAFALGRVLGRNVDAAVLDRIFAEFCIGK